MYVYLLQIVPTLNLHWCLRLYTGATHTNVLLFTISMTTRMNNDNDDEDAEALDNDNEDYEVGWMMNAKAVFFF